MSLDDEAETLLNRVDALQHPCDLDLLIFFVKHPLTLLASEQLATFMGYDVKQLSESLDVLLDVGLVTRSQTRGRVARMYVLSEGGIHRGWLPALVALASTRAGRIALHRVLKTRSTARAKHPFLVRPDLDVTPTSDRSPHRRGTK
jgi:hypothetical protein